MSKRTHNLTPASLQYFLDPESPDYYTEKARQGHSFRMADDIRVVRLLPEGEEHKVPEGGLQETRTDSAEVGEIVMRGNLVMKVRVALSARLPEDLLTRQLCRAIGKTLSRQQRRLPEATSTRVTWQFDETTALSPFRVSVGSHDV